MEKCLKSVLNVKVPVGSFNYEKALVLKLQITRRFACSSTRASDSVSHLGHVGDGVGIVHQFPLVHFNFTQSAKYQIKNFVITTHDSV